jgi:hypothetical protein
LEASNSSSTILKQYIETTGNGEKMGNRPDCHRKSVEVGDVVLLFNFKIF